MIYKPIETHTHTIHSDGDFTVESLLHAAKEFGYEGLILSDHNTDSGYQEVTKEMEKKYMPVIRAMEWTTFFGHVLVIGANRFIDWREAKPDTFDTSLKQIQKANGIVGIAHPFSMSGILYTGGFFEFQVHDWKKVSFIEVFSKAMNESLKSNARALEWWQSLLNRGEHLAITSGRDWHRPDAKERPCMVTYIGSEQGDIDEDTVKEALREGRTYVSYAASLDVFARFKNMDYELGDTVPSSSFTLHVTVDRQHKNEYSRKWNMQWNTLKVIVDGEIQEEIECMDAEIVIPVNHVKKWICVGIYGTLGDDPNEQILAYTSPIYAMK